MDWKKKLSDAGILILVFIAAVIGFSFYTNKGNANMTADMGAATYPQISFSYNGYTLNTLNGYAKSDGCAGYERCRYACARAAGYRCDTVL